MNAYEGAGPTELAEAEPSAPLHAARRTASGLLGASAGLGSTFWGWAGPALIMLFGGFIRFYRLSKPNCGRVRRDVLRTAMLTRSCGMASS